MSYFEFTINNNEKYIVGDENLKYLSLGIISVGPKYEMIIQSNSMYEGEKKTIGLLNKALFKSDEVKIKFMEYKSDVENVSNKKYNDRLIEEVGGCNKLKIRMEDGKECFVMAENDSTLSANFDWLKKDNICWLSIGILSEDGNEQWMKMRIKPAELYTFSVR